MSRYVPDALRRFVAARANFRCEYCRMPEIGTFYGLQVDHITGELLPLTPIGEATIRIFGMNHPGSIIERRLLIAAGHLF